MGSEGLKLATQIAILNANYVAHKLKNHFPILYKGTNGNVAHECIIDIRSIKNDTGVTEEDIAKRLIDFGFHAPTMSWPVPGTMMIEPTESESLKEIDTFCDALASIRSEIKEIEDGTAAKGNNVLSHAPHTAAIICGDTWDRPYSRNKAAFPAKQYPLAIAILRHRPDNRAHVENEGILRPAIWVVTSTSPGRPPPPSVYITIGRANLSACSVIRSNFW